MTVETTDTNWEPTASGRDASLGRPLSDVELLAKLFYNRGLARLSERDFAAALAATELSWQLDHQHESARDNVATVINNWALDLTTKSKFEEALTLLERGRRLVPDHPILYANQAHIRDAWSRQMRAAGQP
jgi:tetratricopeptide (TPR) repeat protein